MNEQNYIPVTDVYEYALKKIQTASAYEQSDLALAFLELQYIDDLIKRKNSKRIFEALANEIASEIYKRTASVDIFQMSAIYYKGKQAGFDTSRLYNAMRNNSEWLISEAFKNINSQKLLSKS